MASLTEWCKKNKRYDFLKEWDYEKNGEQTPDTVQYGCGKKMWWICSKGHSFEATPNGRTCKNQRCPYCAGQKILKGFNDLATTHPSLVKEWDYDKNVDITPFEVSKGQSRNVWWICPKGHSYKASLNNRSRGKGCPYCRNLKILSGYNDFETWCKNNSQLTLLSEWDKEKNDILPSQIPCSYAKNAYWKCSICGKSFESKVAYRVQNNHKAYIEKHGARIIAGCPSCSKKIAQDRNVDALVKKNGSLFDYYPEIAEEWDYEKNEDLTPKQVTYGSIKKVWWRCKLNHSYQATTASRTKGGGCPYCNGKKVLPGFNDIATANPSLLEEWNYEKNTIKPTEITYGADKKVWWKCKVCGYEWEALAYARSSTGCPRCSKELRTSFPEQAIFYYVSKLFPDAINGDRHLKKELDVYIPSENIAIEYDGYKWHSDNKKDIEKDELCKKNGIRLYRIREYGCSELPNSENVSVYMLKDGDRQALSKIIQTICNSISNKKIKVDVEKDEDIIYSQYVSGIKENSFAKKHPELLKYWDYTKNKTIKPDYVTERTPKQVWWICEKGHSYKQSINSKTIGIGCPICSNKCVLKGYNDLKTVRPELASEWDIEKNGDLLPDQVTEHAGRIVWWKGKCGHEWRTSIYSRSGGSGCPYCSVPAKKVLSGFNDLQSKYPDIAAKWDESKNTLKANEVLPGSNKKVWWKCSKGHSYERSITKMVLGRGCPICRTATKV